MCDFWFGRDIWRGMIKNEKIFPGRGIVESRVKVIQYTSSEHWWLLERDIPDT
jgi:hypothetical protein